jgi:hypothetical protein
MNPAICDHAYEKIARLILHCPSKLSAKLPALAFSQGLPRIFPGAQSLALLPECSVDNPRA